MADLATVEDVEALWRPLTTQERTKAQLLLGYASATVRRKVPRVDDRIAAEQLNEDLVTGVVASMVARVMRNPEGWRTETQQAGPFQEQNTRDPELASGELHMTEAELDLLSPDSTGVGSIRLGTCYSL